VTIFPNRARPSPTAPGPGASGRAETMTLTLGEQVLWLFVLAAPVACVSWTVTHEEIFREPREFCSARSRDCGRVVQRKFFYIFTCEYCFSHYVTLFFLLLTDFRLLMPGWRGLLIAFFSLVAVANIYMSAYSRIRVEIRAEKAEIERAGGQG
jgi:hypothetical protein